MKIHIVLFALFLCFFYIVYACVDDECNADWECGNPVYFDCAQQQECIILEGIGTAPGQVFWLERCQNSNGNTSVYVMRADNEGVERVIAVPEITIGSQKTTVIRFVNANPISLYIAKKVPVYAQISGFSVTPNGYSDEFSAFSPRSPYDFQMAFDEENEVTYGCWHPYYGVVIRYPTLNLTSAISGTVYIQITCTALSYSNNEIFWSTIVLVNGTYFTGLIRGDPNCDSCLPPSSFTTIPGGLNAFQVYNNKIYYAQPNEGVKSVDLENPTWENPQVLVASGDINSLSVRDDRVYYNDNSSIKSIGIDGNLPETHSVPSLTPKKCVCVGGFSGENCEECPNGQVQWNNGVPSCVPYNALGFPSSCSADYMCGNMPYARCNTQAQCECATGFYAIPPACDTCLEGYHIAWNNGIPSCISI